MIHNFFYIKKTWILYEITKSGLWENSILIHYFKDVVLFPDRCTSVWLFERLSVSSLGAGISPSSCDMSPTSDSPGRSLPDSLAALDAFSNSCACIGGNITTKTIVQTITFSFPSQGLMSPLVHSLELNKEHLLIILLLLLLLLLYRTFNTQSYINML